MLDRRLALAREDPGGTQAVVGPGEARVEADRLLQVGNRQRVLLPDDPRLAVNASKYPSPAGPATLIARTGGRGEIARSAARLPRRVERGPYERPPAEGGR